jgi:hypothetical protein
LPAETYYVAPQGAKNANGTLERPFGSVQEALQAAQAKKAKDTPLTIVLRGGRHELSDTIRLGKAISGKKDQPTVLRAHTNEVPILSGGIKIEGWTLHDEKKGIYKAKAPGFSFRQLYVAGQRAIRARTPNRDNIRTMSPLFRLSAWVSHEGKNYIRVKKSDLAGYDLAKDFDGAEIVIFRHWDQHRLRISGTDLIDDKHVHFLLREPEGSSSLQAPYPQQSNDQAYYLENSYAFLDAPGEWFLDSQAGQIYYIPRLGEDMKTIEVYVPRIERLLEAKDVHSLHIQGLTFEHSTWLEPDKQGYVGLQAMNFYDRGEGRASGIAPAALVFTDCSYIAFEKNVVQNTGSTGLAFAGNSHHNRIRGNVLRHTGGNALHMNLDNNRRIATHNDEISHNYVYSYGRDYHGGVGMLLSYCYDTVVEHNRVFHGPYTGISVGWGWTLKETTLRNIKVRFNDVHDVSETMDDGACLYTLSRQDGTHIFENYFHDLTRSPWAGHHPHYSLYFDQGSMNIKAERNVLHHESRDFYDGTIYLQTFANGTKDITLVDNDIQEKSIITRAGPKPPHAPDWHKVDDNPPWVRHVWCAQPGRILLHFSEPIERASAENVEHYNIDNGVKIESARLIQPEKVELRVTALQRDTSYKLRVRKVRDTSAQGNFVADPTVLAFHLGNVSLTDTRFGLKGKASALGEVSKQRTGSASAAFDRNKNTHWAHDTPKGKSWLQYEWEDGVKVRVHKYTLHAPPAPPWHNQYDPPLFPALVTLQGSNDGTNWTNLDSNRAIKWPPETPSRTFEVAKPAAFSRYRLVIHSTVGPERNRVLIAHLDLFGTVEPE